METSPGMPPTAEALAQREAIRDILSTHSRGLDRLDPDLLKHAYWPDAEVDYGAFKGSAHQFAEIISPALSSQFELTQHLLGQTLITLDGDRANSETYVLYKKKNPSKYRARNNYILDLLPESFVRSGEGFGTNVG